MLDATTVAKYFISKDKERKLFNRNVVEYNSRTFYEGNARLNKYLFLAQVVFLAKNNKRLFSDDFSAYTNGPVIQEVVNSYGRLIIKDESIVLEEDIKYFLDQIYMSLENATYEELIEITHEDPEWIKLSKDTYHAPIMNLEENIDVYKKRYKGLIEALKL